MGRIRILASAAFLALGLAQPAAAQSLEWRFKSEHPNVVNFELYAQDRDRVWPGGNEVYTLNDYSTRTVEISCRRGEKICYGAWVRNTRSSTWGSGPDDKGSCRSCCFICDGGRTPVLVLE
ncbi:MAG TPA: hypothetical protein VIL72_00655 [Beijerinckiaceae bacterium]|jgi:hypothetical protein